MKIKKAHIDGFGKWHDQDFDFTANPQIIYGPNEAGKTTLMAFLVSIYSALRMGGERIGLPSIFRRLLLVMEEVY